MKWEIASAIMAVMFIVCELAPYRAESEDVAARGMFSFLLVIAAITFAVLGGAS